MKLVLIGLLIILQCLEIFSARLMYSEKDHTPQYSKKDSHHPQYTEKAPHSPQYSEDSDDSDSIVFPIEDDDDSEEPAFPSEDSGDAYPSEDPDESSEEIEENIRPQANSGNINKTSTTKQNLPRIAPFTSVIVSDFECKENQRLDINGICRDMRRGR